MNEAVLLKYREVIVIEKYLTYVCFELTRRCNMTCDFCSRGDPQNVDITERVIDRTLDEIKGFNVYGFRVSGGEPTLNKRGLIYLIDEVIRRDFKILYFNMFTNGTVQDDEIKQALVRIGEHCRRCHCSKWGREAMQFYSPRLENNYNIDSYASVIVSIAEHDNSGIAEDTIKFYNSGIDRKILSAVNQDISIKGGAKAMPILSIDGNAEKNIEQLYKKYKLFRLYDNHCSLIDEHTDNYIFVTKTLTISANGNVIAGITRSYVNADKDYICNILNCKNLFYWIKKYSWDNPLSQEQLARKMQASADIYLNERGLPLPETSELPDEIRLMFSRGLVECMQEYCKAIKEIHQKRRMLRIDEARELVGLMFAREEDDVEFRKILLFWLCEYEYEDIESHSIEDINRRIAELNTMYSERVYKKLFG